MQHNRFLKKLNFDLLTPTRGSRDGSGGGGGGGGKGVCWQNICHHAAAFVIPFNLICNMTVSRLKKLNFDIDPTP